MNPDSGQPNRRILVIDDNASIHADFKKILSAEPVLADLDAAEAGLFGHTRSNTHRGFELTTALQGQEGLAALQQAMTAGHRFAVAFVDIRMPPGWDGIETIGHLWKADPDLQVVICTAYSDYSWDDMAARLKASDQLVILKKPFDVAEVLQLANALTAKWTLTQQAKISASPPATSWRTPDISERTRELRSANEQLQKEVRERQQTEQTLRATQEKLKHFLAKSPAVLYSLRFEGRRLMPRCTPGSER